MCALRLEGIVEERGQEGRAMKCELGTDLEADKGLDKEGLEMIEGRTRYGLIGTEEGTRDCGMMAGGAMDALAEEEEGMQG